jgi:hypothetical protein
MAGKDRRLQQRFRHQGFLDQWLVEADLEKRRRDYDESLQSFGRQLPRPKSDEDSKPVQRDLVRSWPLR